MNIGKVFNYDGVTGHIVTDNETYLFSYIGLLEKNIKAGDLVYFVIRDKEDKIATDIRLYNDDSTKK